MASMPPPARARNMREIFAYAMSLADGCPECTNTQPPRAAIPIEGGWMCSYQCADCAHTWTTAYEERN